MAKPTVLFAGALGLNNADDPRRLKHVEGLVELGEAINVDITPTGRCDLRQGKTLLLAGAYHSAFTYAGDTLIGGGTILSRLDNGTLRTLATGLSGDQIRFQGLGSRIYWVNGRDKGYVTVGGSNNNWTGSYVGPETSKDYSDPPAGHLLGLYRGHLLVGTEIGMEWSDPLAPHLFRKSANYFPMSRPTAIMPVTTGVFVSSSEALFYFGGEVLRTAERVKVYDLPVREGSEALCEWGDLSDDAAGPGWLCLSDGLLALGPGGIVRNLTRGRVVLPSGGRSAAIVRNQNFAQYIATL